MPRGERRIGVYVYLEPEVAEALRRLAQAHRLPLSQVAARLLKEAMQREADTSTATLFLPAVQQTIRQEVGRMSHRLAHLLARTALEAATARRLLYHHMAYPTAPLPDSHLKEIHNQAWQLSVERLRQPLAELAAILEAAGAAANGEAGR